MTELQAPFDRYRDHVRPEWIDGNGHMNVGYYLVVFDYATDEFLSWVGLDARHRREHRVTTFCLEAHVSTTARCDRRTRSASPRSCSVTTRSASTTSTRCTTRRGDIWRRRTS